MRRHSSVLKYLGWINLYKHLGGFGVCTKYTYRIFRNDFDHFLKGQVDMYDSWYAKRYKELALILREAI